MTNEDVVSNDQRPASRARALALLLAATTGTTVSASDWRQFRGPNGSGIAAIDAQPATTCFPDTATVANPAARGRPGTANG